MVIEGYEDTRLVSEYNEAYFQISRLHNIWLNCKSNRETGNLVGYRWILDTATLELWNDAVRLDEEKKDNEFVKKLNDIDKEIEEACKGKNFNNFYSKLMEKEKLLRLIQETSGKGAKFKSSDDDGL